MSKKLYITGIVVAALSIWIGTRWNTWFGNPPEPPYTTSTAPHHILLTFGQDQNSRIICWQAGEEIDRLQSLIYKDESDSTAINVENPKAILDSTRGGKVAFYSVTLQSLKPGHKYSYCIKPVGVDDAPWYSFEMPKDSQPEHSFIFFGDVQDSVGGISKSVFKHVANTHSNADFWLFGGDLIERPISCYWDLVFNDLDSIAQCKPMLAIAGNHEYLKGIRRILDSRFGNTFQYFQTSKVGDNHVYRLDYNGASLFLLDSNVDSWQLTDQADWLEKNLKNCPADNWKIVVLHHPLHSNKGAYYNLPVKWAFKSLVEDLGVHLVLSGHEHVYARYNEKEKRKDTTAIDKLPLYIDSYCSPKHYRLYFDEPEDRIGTDGRFYQKITFNEDALMIETFDAANNGQLYDKVMLDRSESKPCSVEEFGTSLDPQQVRMSDWYRTVKKPKRVKEYEDDIKKWEMSQK